MTANEILGRQKFIDIDMDRLEGEDTQRRELASLGICYWLAELALQLAELNSNLAGFKDATASHDGRLMVSVKGWTE